VKLVSLADVAKLAGVTRPAVSNWRRRHRDFPKPVRETGAVSLFSLTEIEAWLSRNQKKQVASTVREEIAAALNTVRTDITITRAAEIGMTVLAAQVIEPFDVRFEHEDPTTVVRLAEQIVYDHLAEPPFGSAWQDADGAAPLVNALPSLVREHGAVSVAEALIAEVTEQERRATGWLTTPRGLADLMVTLAGDLSGTVYDPACGVGTTLLAVQRAAGEKPLRIVGNEAEPVTHLLGALRMITHGVAATVLRRDSWHDHRQADFVFANPPFERDSDWDWLKQTIQKINDGGQGFHVSPHTLLVRSGADARQRAALVHQDAVEAVVQLPPDLYAGASARSALWLLRPLGEAKAPTVLLVDARQAGTRRGSTVELAQKDIDDIVATYRWWRKDGPPAKHEFPAVAVAKERLLAGECRLEVAFWAANGTDSKNLLTRIQMTRSRLRDRVEALAELPLPEQLAKGSVDRRPIHELLDSGEADLVRGLRLTPEQLSRAATGDTPVIWVGDLGDDLLATPSRKAELGASRRDRPFSRPGDVVISVDGPEVRAAVVTGTGAVVQAPLQCLRLRRPSMVRARAIAAVLSAGMPSVPYAEVRELSVRWPSDEECERIDRSLDEMVRLRRTAAAAAREAEQLMASTLRALAMGAVPVDDHDRPAVFE
jgi:predicted DNA-binding transcriptional regulator AlpA/predicted RNA methylase